MDYSWIIILIVISLSVSLYIFNKFIDEYNYDFSVKSYDTIINKKNPLDGKSFTIESGTDQLRNKNTYNYETTLLNLNIYDSPNLGSNLLVDVGNEQKKFNKQLRYDDFGIIGLYTINTIDNKRYLVSVNDFNLLQYNLLNENDEIKKILSNWFINFYLIYLQIIHDDYWGKNRTEDYTFDIMRIMFTNYPNMDKFSDHFYNVVNDVINYLIESVKKTPINIDINNIYNIIITDTKNSMIEDKKSFYAKDKYLNIDFNGGDLDFNTFLTLIGVHKIILSHNPKLLGDLTSINIDSVFSENNIQFSNSKDEDKRKNGKKDQVNEFNEYISYLRTNAKNYCDNNIEYDNIMNFYDKLYNLYNINRFSIDDYNEKISDNIKDRINAKDTKWEGKFILNKDDKSFNDYIKNNISNLNITPKVIITYCYFDSKLIIKQTSYNLTKKELDKYKIYFNINFNSLDTNKQNKLLIGMAKASINNYLQQIFNMSDNKFVYYIHLDITNGFYLINTNNILLDYQYVINQRKFNDSKFCLDKDYIRMIKNNNNILPENVVDLNIFTHSAQYLFVNNTNNISLGGKSSLYFYEDNKYSYYLPRPFEIKSSIDILDTFYPL